MQIILERSEADHAMSWLSTLGGAFSALGENFEHCVSCGFPVVTFNHSSLQNLFVSLFVCLR